MRLTEILSRIEDWIPADTAASYDNVGLQVGDENAKVKRGLIALDLTYPVLNEAVHAKAQIIVTHHPLLFNPLTRVSANHPIGSLVLGLARHGVSLVAAHTNLDAARDGVSAGLAETIGLEGVEVLDGLDDSSSKLVTFVPKEHLAEVRAALSAAGAGQIGAYEECAFEVSGRGVFRPTPGADPYIGSVDETEFVEEVRIEMVAPSARIGAVVTALLKTHPYETPAFDLYPLKQSTSGLGFGKIGRLPKAESATDFLERVCRRLETPSVRYSGSQERQITTVAVCGGAGRDLIRTAASRGADAYVTADLSYHNYFETLDAEGQPGLLIVDAGHYETERCAELLLAKRLEQIAPQVEWIVTQHRTSPMRHYLRPYNES